MSYWAEIGLGFIMVLWAIITCTLWLYWWKMMYQLVESTNRTMTIPYFNWWWFLGITIITGANMYYLWHNYYIMYVHIMWR